MTEAESCIEESSEESDGGGPTDHTEEVDSDTSCYEWMVGRIFERHPDVCFKMSVPLSYE